MMRNRILRHYNNTMEEEYFVGLKIRESIVLAFRLRKIGISINTKYYVAYKYCYYK